MIEQQIRDLEASVQDMRAAQQAGANQGLLRQKQIRIRKLRLSALRNVQTGDVRSLIRALGIPRAHDACMVLGVGSLIALQSCTRNQFSLYARPKILGWGSGAAVPKTIDRGIVDAVGSTLVPLGIRWREPSQQPATKLPEAVLSAEFNAFDPVQRFHPDGNEFMGYAHVDLIAGNPSKNIKPLIAELTKRGVYCWKDLTNRTGNSLLSTGLPREQYATVFREMQKRGLSFEKAQKPEAVLMDAIDTDKFEENFFVSTPHDTDYEDKIIVRDKYGVTLSEIHKKDEYIDRAGVEADIDPTAAESPVGLTENFDEYEDLQ